MKKPFFNLFLIYCTLFLQFSSYAQTFVSGDITKDTTWTSDNNPIILTGNIIVAADAELRIEKGVVIKPENPTIGLDVYGTLKIMGTLGEPVVFTSYSDDSFGGDTNGDEDATVPKPGDWRGINFFYPGGENVLKNAKVYYGSGASAGGVIYNESLSLQLDSCYFFQSDSNAVFSSRSVMVTNCELQNNKASGIFLDLENASAEINLLNNQIENCSDFPVILKLGGTNVVFNSKKNTSTGSDINAIMAANENLGNLTFQGDSLLPLLIDEGKVPELTAFIVEPESKISFLNSQSRIEVKGELQALGTESSPVIFTSVGDTTGAESVLTDWNGIVFLNTKSGNLLKNAHFSYGGSHFQGMIVINQSKVEIDSCFFHQSSQAGIYSTGANLELKNSVLSENRESGLEIVGYADSLIVRNCEFHSNDGDGIYARDIAWFDISESSFSNNQYGIEMIGSHFQCDVKSNSFTSNALDAVRIFEDYMLDEISFVDNYFSKNRYPVNAVIDNIHYDIVLSGNEAAQNAKNGFFLHGSISGNVTMSHHENFPWLIGSLGINQNAVLNFSAGTVVKFDQPNFGFGVNGNVFAKGTEELPVVFTSIKDDTVGGDTNNDGESEPEINDWNVIRVFKSSSKSVFEHCHFKYGGGIVTESDSTMFINCSFENLAYTAIECRKCSPYISQNRFINLQKPVFHFIKSDSVRLFNNYFENFTLPVFFEADSIVKNISFENQGNEFYGTGIRGVGIKGDIFGEVVFHQNNNFPTLIHSLNVTSNAKLTFSEGGVYKFFGTGIRVYGILNVEGTEEKPVVFTSLKDDAHGGDLNNDGSETSPRKGDWGAIHFYDNFKESNLSCLWMGYGGGGANDHGMLELYESSTSRFNPSILVDRCVITKSAKHGIWLVYESSPEITNCKIIDNYQDGIYTQQSRPALKNNEISGNNRYGVNNAYPYYEVDARQNYWGDASGPYHPVKNPSGKGNEVSDNVLFMPKLSSPAESFWTGLENFKTAGESIIVYPNPAKSWFTMEFNSPQEAISVNLWDAGGNLVDVLLTDSFSAKKKHHVANLKPGIYFVEVITEQSRKYKKLIIAD